MLKSLPLKQIYSSSEDDLIHDFYNPILSESIKYDRITGFFSPRVLALASKGFSCFLHDGGSIRIITSVEISSELYNAVKNLDGEELCDALLSADALGQIDIYQLEDELERNYLKLFIALMKSRIVQLKIAVVEKDDGGIFHQKIGIVRDENDDGVSFSGSVNETLGGWIKNIEEYKVFTSWDIATSVFYQHDIASFEKYWNNSDKTVKVLTINEAIRERLIKVSEDENIDIIRKRIKRLENNNDDNTNTVSDSGRILFEYQEDAIEHWINNNYCSIYEMATGTGKTFTSINAIKKFQADNGYLRAVIVVPYSTLVLQWQNELQEEIPDANIIIASSLNTLWRNELRSLSRLQAMHRKKDFIVITTYSTFSSENFKDLLRKFNDDIILVADEMHNIVTESNINAAKMPQYRYKLGLSATPVRLWKPYESSVVIKLFGNNSYVYSLSKAIKNNFLVHYDYMPIPVHLTLDEYDDYVAISNEMSRLSWGEDNSNNQPYKMAQMKRSRIKKQAFEKAQALTSILREKDKNLYNALIYTDSNESIEKIQEQLSDINIKTTKFTGSESAIERMEIISSLNSHMINAIVAIKCLDEGVDIPSATTAFLLANNTDPREYVQRLGRVLRKDKNNPSKHATVYDFIVFPPLNVEQEDTVARNLVRNELIRCRFFSELADNGDIAWANLYEHIDNYGYYFEESELTYNNKKGQEDADIE